MLNTQTKKRIKESLRVKILIILVAITLIVLMFPKGESLESEVTVGAIWIQDDLIASTSFEILKDPEVYTREKLKASEDVEPIFVKDENAYTRVMDSISSYKKFLVESIDKDLFSGSESDANPTSLSPRSYQTFKLIRRSENILSSGSKIALNDVLNSSISILSKLYKNNILNINYEEIEKDSISIREGKFETVNSKYNFLDIDSARKQIIIKVNESFGSRPEQKQAVNEFLTYFLRANLIYSKTLTEEARKIAEDKVSINIGIVNENERIVAKHDRITPEIKMKIDSYTKAKGVQIGFWGSLIQNIGKFLHILIILVLYIIYIFLFRKKIYRDNLKILLIVIIFLIVCFFAFLTNQINVKAPVELLILVPVASMLLTIIYDSRVGFYGTVIVALLAGGLRGNDYVFTVMNIIAGALAAYTVRDIKNRTQIFRSFLFILIGYVISIIAFGLERFFSVEQMLIHSAFAASNALISPILTYGLIIFVEKIFKITTDLTLLELTDFNSPLLKELARKAPGSFTHSMTIGSLVEGAAETIGANPTLARVGAYYHDIGKTLNPENFVENQQGNSNIHESLDPRESARIIIDHVIKGIELAEANKLPKDIIDFIPMHHGTTVVYYFYEKAKEKYGEDKVKIKDYQYPGPKPNTKEAALLMLADACESTVRSINEPDTQKIENVINNIVRMRIDDGQLDEAPLTLLDINNIKASFLASLVGQYHKRIRYPKQDALESSSDAKPE